MEYVRKRLVFYKASLPVGIYMHVYTGLFIHHLFFAFLALFAHVLSQKGDGK